MTNLLLASQEAFPKISVEFPNLFGGMQIEYYRGFNVFGVPIYWYGVIIAVGVVLAYFYAMHRATKDFGLVKDRVFDVVFVCLIGGFLFARIYYCVFTELKNPGTYNFITVFTKIRDGGIAIYGGIIGAVVVGLVMCKLRKVNFFAMVDLASLGFLIGQTLGRWGNFVNQEAYGAVCDPDWIFGMTGTNIAQGIPINSLVHPCFLYESTWCLLGFIFLHIYSKKLRTYDGEIALLYVTWYGFGRMFIEGLRTDSLYAGSIRISQLVAFVSFIAGLALFITFKIITKRSGKPLYVNSAASAELIEHDKLIEEAKKAQKTKSPAEAETAEVHEDSEDIEDINNSEDSENTDDNSENSEDVDNETED